MKQGFRIDIQSDLTEDELKLAMKFSDDFIIRTLQSPTKTFGGLRSHGGRDTPYSRGTCMVLGGVLFLRINRHKRIFGAVRKDSIDDASGYGKLKLKPNVPLFTYAQVGDIKG